MRKQSRRDFVRVIFLASQAMALGPGLARMAAAAPASGGQAGRLSFLALGDWGRDGEPHQLSVARQMAATATTLKPEFIISVGDNFYDNGVTSIKDAHWQESFEKVYDAPSLQKPWHVVLGNHDYHGNCDAQIAYHEVNPRWNMPSRYYARTQQLPDGVKVDFFFLDTTPMAKPAAEDKKYQAGFDAASVPRQLAWFKEALAASTAPWKIVVGHHGIYSGGAHGDNPMLIKHVLPLIEQYKAQVYLHGHDHDLQHLQAGKVNLFCCGAGSKVRSTKLTKRTQFAASTPGFAAVTVENNHLFVRLIDAQGKVLHIATVPQKPA